jgi:hypothetical protein
MASSSTDFPARGNVVRADAGGVVFNPVGTSYEVKLAVPGGYGGPTGGRVDGVVRATARKVYTIASGGNFVAPIFGPPRILQGRVRYLDQTTMVLSCGMPVIVTLPASDSAFDLANGGLAVGSLVNVTLLPGASFELAAAAVV